MQEESSCRPAALDQGGNALCASKIWVLLQICESLHPQLNSVLGTKSGQAAPCLWILILFLRLRGEIADEPFSRAERLRSNTITDNAFQKTAFTFCRLRLRFPRYRRSPGCPSRGARGSRFRSGDPGQCACQRSGERNLAEASHHA